MPPSSRFASSFRLLCGWYGLQIVVNVSGFVFVTSSLADAKKPHASYYIIVKIVALEQMVELIALV
jgi:hypothetical protein